MSQRELGGVGEGLWVIEGAQPLTQLQLGSTLPSFRNPLPLERVYKTKPPCSNLGKTCRANISHSLICG